MSLPGSQADATALCKEPNAGPLVLGVEKAALSRAPPQPLAAGVSNGTPFSAYLLPKFCKKKLMACWESPGASPRSRRQGAQHRVGAIQPCAGAMLDSSGTVLGGSCPDWRGQPWGQKSIKYPFTLKREELEVGNYRLRVRGCLRTPWAAQPRAPLLEAGRRGHGTCPHHVPAESWRNGKAQHQLSPHAFLCFHPLPLHEPLCTAARELLPASCSRGNQPTPAPHTSAKAHAVLHPKYAVLSLL